MKTLSLGIEELDPNYVPANIVTEEEAVAASELLNETPDQSVEVYEAGREVGRIAESGQALIGVIDRLESLSDSAEEALQKDHITPAVAKVFVAETTREINTVDPEPLPVVASTESLNISPRIGLESHMTTVRERIARLQEWLIKMCDHLVVAIRNWIKAFLDQRTRQKALLKRLSKAMDDAAGKKPHNANVEVDLTYLTLGNSFDDIYNSVKEARGLWINTTKLIDANMVQNLAAVKEVSTELLKKPHSSYRIPLRDSTQVYETANHSKGTPLFFEHKQRGKEVFIQAGFKPRAKQGEEKSTISTPSPREIIGFIDLLLNLEASLEHADLLTTLAASRLEEQTKYAVEAAGAIAAEINHKAVAIAELKRLATRTGSTDIHYCATATTAVFNHGVHLAKRLANQYRTFSL